MTRAATDKRTARTFSSGAYLQRLMAELNRAEIAARIAEARTEAGLSQPELAELLEPPVHFRTVQTWESTKDVRVPWDRLDEIARIAGKTKEWMLHGEVEQPPSIDAERVEQLFQQLEASGRELRDDLARRHDELIRRFDELGEQFRLSAVGRDRPPG